MKQHSPIIHLPYHLSESSNRFHFYENHWKRVALTLLRQQAGDVQGWTLLDYGCGRGETMDYAARMGMLPCGLDTDPRCVDIARRYGPTQVLDPLNGLDKIPPSSYDVVACLHVLEHVENPKATLTLLARATKRYLIVAVPNLQKIPNFRKPHAAPNKTNEGHLQSWDHAHFRNLAENHCGLEVLAWGHDATTVPVISELVRSIFGNKAIIHLETGLFRRMFPFWGLSVIALLAKKLPSTNA